MEQKKEYYASKYFFLGILLVFGMALFFSLAEFFTAFLGAIIFYVLCKPALLWVIEKKKWNKTFAAIVAILVSFFIVLLPVSLLVILLFNKVSHVVTNPGDIITTLKHFDEVIYEQTNIHVISTNSIAQIQSVASGALKTILNQGLGLFSSLIMMYFFLFFLITNINKMEAAIMHYLPFKGEKIERFGNELVALTLSNAIGIPTIAVLQGLLGFFCYLLAGLHEPGFWGVITGFTSVIPVVGCGIVWVLMAVIQLVTGNYGTGIFILIWGAILMGLIDNIVRFILAKKMADVHPVITVLGIIMGLKMFGITGLIFGPLLISYFFILLQIYYVEFQKPMEERPPNKPRQLVTSYMHPILDIKNKPKNAKCPTDVLSLK